MVWVVSLSAMDLSTQSLTPEYMLLAFGVCQGLVGDVKPPSPISSSTSMTTLIEAVPKNISGSTSYLPV